MLLENNVGYAKTEKYGNPYLIRLHPTVAGDQYSNECQRRKFSAKNPENMLKLGSVASMGLPKYLLKFCTIYCFVITLSPAFFHTLLPVL